MEFPEGSSKKEYKGQWGGGMFHGKGEHVWVDNSIYTGEYCRGKKDGWGRFTFPSQKYYEGFWVDGVQEGVGSLVSNDGTELKKGLWVSGAFKKTMT